MSETDLDREPIELVELVLPKCANVFGSAPCTATGEKCYNTRATCADQNNYRAVPDMHLIPDQSYANLDVVVDTDLDLNASVFAAFDVRFATVPNGIIWEQGSSSAGTWLGVNSGNLVFRAGFGGTIPASNAGEIRVDVTPYIGKSLILFCEIKFTISGTCTINLWAFDKVELTNTLVGTDTFVDNLSVWANTNDGRIGALQSATVSGENSATWNGGIDGAFFYNTQEAPADMSDNFRRNIWLGRGDKGEPTNEKYIFPCLTDLGTVSTRINLSGVDDNYEPLGRRSTLGFSCADFPHTDLGYDEYTADRTTDPLTVGTFWTKWLVREKYGKVGALARVYDGYADESLADYRKRAYIIDSVKFSETSISFHCRDVLSKTEFRKAQKPVASSGVLNQALLTAETGTMYLTGDVTEDYPSAGTVRINDETISYTATAYVGASGWTTFTTLTRGTDGSEPDDHEADDLVQTCVRYTNAAMDDVLKEWLLEDAEIPAQFVSQESIENEYTDYLSAYTVTTLLSEPTGISELVGQLSLECSFFIWWDERAQQIDLRAIRSVDPIDIVANFTYEDNIIGGSFKMDEKPKQRLNVVTAYYNPAQWTEDLTKPSHFKNGLKVINGTTSLPEQYGNVVQSLEIFSIFLTTEAQLNQTTSRLAVRYADIPQFANFYVDAKDRGVWVGDVVTISHPRIISEHGTRVIRRWLVIEGEEVDPGHLVRYVCADVTLDGTIYLITENGIGSYTAELFAESNAFITDNAGLNSDGTTGATIG